MIFKAISSTFFKVLSIVVGSSANEVTELREVDEGKFGNEFFRKSNSEVASNARLPIGFKIQYTRYRAVEAILTRSEGRPLS